MNKRNISLIVCIAIVLAVFYYVRNPLVTKVIINNHVFTVDVAVTGAEKERGLSFRESLAPNRGMLFPYDNPQAYRFWMKDMRFPIDIIWIRDKIIVDITKNAVVQKDGKLTVYSPRMPADSVLEINAGLSDTVGIKIGNRVIIDN